eukprot:UN20644
MVKFIFHLTQPYVRRDLLEMFIHHSVFIALIFFAYLNNWIHFASIVVFCTI